MNAKLTGDWSKAESVLSSLTTTIPELALVMRSEAQNSKKRMVGKIKSGSYSFVPLAASTKVGRPSTPILIDSGSYVDAIDVVSTGPLLVGVGIKSGAKGENGQSLAEVGLAHEFGTGHMPPRPHWRKEYQLYKRSLAIKLSALLGRKISLAR